jgi:cytidylate kinase
MHMTEHLPRSIEQIVEDQGRRWALVRRTESPAPRRPVIAISRQHGAGGGDVARRLALELGVDFFDREIIAEIGRSAHLSARVVSTLDEKDRDVLSDWLVSFANVEHLSPAAYRAHLGHVIDVIATHGGAVILGRGAHLFLGSTKALRVFVVAPLDARIAEVGRREGLSEAEARRRIAAVEAERRAFLARHFPIDSSDLSTFDLVVNTGVIGIAGAVAAARTAAEAIHEAVLALPGS